MASKQSSDMHKSHEPHLTRATWVKIIVILLVTLFIFTNMWSCMTGGNTDYSTKHITSETAANTSSSNPQFNANSAAVASPNGDDAPGLSPPTA